MLVRTLEPEVMSNEQEVEGYDLSSFEEVNARFVEDLLQQAPVGTDVIDLGCGPAEIPTMLVERSPDVRVVAVDASTQMLDVAHYRVQMCRSPGRIALRHGRVGELPFADGDFDCVMSNSLVHHLPDPAVFFGEAARLCRPGGLVFCRDLYRPSDEATLEALVERYGAADGLIAAQNLRQSLHAALMLDEVQSTLESLGLGGSVEMTSDRHWTWVWRTASPAGPPP